jgi:hypothetical protein
MEHAAREPHAPSPHIHFPLGMKLKEWYASTAVRYFFTISE